MIGKIGAALVALALLVGVVVGGITLARAYTAETVQTCEVTAKERNYDREGEFRNVRVYTEECGTFRVEDALLKGHFRAGDVYGSIEEGETYEITSHGFRNGFFSMFPNVIEVEEVQ